MKNCQDISSEPIGIVKEGRRVENLKTCWLDL